MELVKRGLQGPYLLNYIGLFSCTYLERLSAANLSIRLTRFRPGILCPADYLRAIGRCGTIFAIMADSRTI